MLKLKSHFDSDYSEEIATKHEHIKVLCSEAGPCTEVRFTASDVKKAVFKLNGDEFAYMRSISKQQVILLCLF